MCQFSIAVPFYRNKTKHKWRLAAHKKKSRFPVFFSQTARVVLAQQREFPIWGKVCDNRDLVVFACHSEDAHSSWLTEQDVALRDKTKVVQLLGTNLRNKVKCEWTCRALIDSLCCVVWNAHKHAYKHSCVLLPWRQERARDASSAHWPRWTWFRGQKLRWLLWSACLMPSKSW